MPEKEIVFGEKEAENHTNHATGRMSFFQMKK